MVTVSEEARNKLVEYLRENNSTHAVRVILSHG